MGLGLLSAPRPPLAYLRGLLASPPPLYICGNRGSESRVLPWLPQQVRSRTGARIPVFWASSAPGTPPVTCVRAARDGERGIDLTLYCWELPCEQLSSSLTLFLKIVSFMGFLPVRLCCYMGLFSSCGE